MRPSSNQKMYFTITLTKRNGFEISEVQALIELIQAKCENAYLAEEFGDGGNRHVQGVLSLSFKRTDAVHSWLDRMYGCVGLESTTRSVCVKKCTNLCGALIYTEKEISSGGRLLLIKGWKSSWIDQQVKNNVKDIPYKMLKKKKTILGLSTAAAVIHEYGLAHNMHVDSKESFVLILKAMSDNGFAVGHLRMVPVYRGVRDYFGTFDRDVMDGILNDLNFC